MLTIILADNGSIRPEATLQLRQLAHQLSVETGQTIHPVSLQHADRIPYDLINNTPADTLYDFIDQKLAEGSRQYIVLPLFFGLSKAITVFIPDTVTALEKKHGKFDLKVADVIYPLPDGEPLLIDILYAHSRAASTENSQPMHYVLVDHGSPAPQVTQVREHISSRLTSRLNSGSSLEQAVMERRQGEKYDFNGELLEDWLTNKAEAGIDRIVVLLMFFLPGRHAGKNGDIEQICSHITTKYPALDITISPLVGQHSLLVKLLGRRLNSVINEHPTQQSIADEHTSLHEQDTSK